MDSDQELFVRLGGEPAIVAAVDLMYTKVLKDPLVKDFFKNVDMKLQKERQSEFLTMAFGGPNNYHGQDMRKAHQNLKISDEQFDKVNELLLQSLKELGIKEEMIQEVGEVVESVRDDVLLR